jgi:Fe-S oxidoreductase
MAEATQFPYGDTSSVKPFWAKAELLAKLNDKVPAPRSTGNLPCDVLAGIRGEAARNRNVKLTLDACVRCGACLNACPTYLTTGDIHNSPVGRADLVRRALKADTFWGRLFRTREGVEARDEASVQRLATYYYQCLECRRCGEICPFGLDQGDVTRSVRSVLMDCGIASRYLATVIETSERTGNNLGLPPPAIKNTIEFCRDEIREEKGVDVRVKVDEPAYAMLVPPSADFFLNLETLKGYMLFFHEAGIDYTFTTEHAELGNFGLFVGEKHMAAVGDHIVQVAKKLGVQLVIAGECGHGWRAFKQYVIPRLRAEGIEGVHVFHAVIDAIRRGTVRLDPAQNGDARYVYQDPCNYARAGDLVDEPRFILERVVRDHRESPHSREATWCCGGGGGLLTDELMPLRLAYAQLWFDDARSVGGEQVVRPCAICKAQLNATLPKLNKVEKTQLRYSGLMDLVYKALVSSSAPPAEA